LGTRRLGLVEELRAAFAHHAPGRWHDCLLALLDGKLAEAAVLVDEAGWTAMAAIIRLEAAEELIEAGRRAEADEQLAPALEEFPDAWSAVVGEIVYDLRSALDHAVYDLTCIENGGPLGQTGFPIFEDESKYDELTTRGEPAIGSGVFKIRGVNPYAKAAIRSLQPFEARKAVPFDEPALSLLGELNAVDRQRTVPLCRLRWTGSTIRSRRPVRDLRF